MSVLLSVEKLSKRYEGFFLEDVDLSLAGGEVVGLVGENGAGKSTLMKCMLGITKPNAGTTQLTVDGSTTRDSRTIRLKTGYTPEEQILYDWMKVRRALRFYSQFFPTWDSAHAARLVERFELPLDKKLADLSRGMKAKFLLTTALAHRPAILLLDEPTVGLDPSARDDLIEHLRSFRTENTDQAMLISSHILSDIESLTDQVVFLHKGRVKLAVPTRAVREEWKKVTLRLPAGLDGLPNADGELVCSSSGSDGTLLALMRKFNGALPAVWATHGASLINSQPASMQDVYLGVIKGIVR
jgi:ABC-2 type transport system ATP-binding protein